MLGFLNPFLYQTGFSQNTNNAFFDITTGSNPGCGTDGFYAQAGWDPGMCLVQEKKSTASISFFFFFSFRLFLSVFWLVIDCLRCFSYPFFVISFAPYPPSRLPTKTKTNKSATGFGAPNFPNLLEAAMKV